MTHRSHAVARLVLALVVIAAFFGCSGAWAQQSRASLSGLVTDPSGAAIPDATVTVTNVQTGQSSRTVAGSAGNYHIGFLSPGTYSIQVEKRDFKTILRKGIELEIGAAVTVDFQMSPGRVTQTVTVTAATPLLETQNATRGLTIGTARIASLPTQGRNPMVAVWSSPGVMVTTHVQRIRPFDTQGMTGITVNGSQPGFNNVLIDGVTAMSHGNNDQNTVSFMPSLDAINQLKVQNTNYNAKFGNTLGGVINIATKSGTNHFHGAAWEYFQNTVLNANTFNQNFAHQPRSSSHINTFGFDIGGPILKDKLFFFYEFEDLRQVIPDPFTTSVPTPLQKQGNFSQTFFAPGQLQTIYNPFSTTMGPDGKLTRTPFPNNIIPASMLNPVAVKVLSFIPDPNSPGNAVTGLGNFVNNNTSRKFTDYFPENTIRVDYDINPSTRLFVRYSNNSLAEARQFIYSTTSALNPADTSNNAPFGRQNHNATIQVTKVLNPTTVLNVQVGFDRFRQFNEDGEGKGHGPATLGFSSTFGGQAANWFPKFNWANYNGAGAQPSFSNPVSYNYAINASVEKVIGRDVLDFGTQLDLDRSNLEIPGFNAGNFTFNQEFTGANPLAVEPSSGNAIASFLLGTPASGFIQIQPGQALQQKNISLYIQNNIQVTDRLHLNLGLRWDYMGPLTDRNNAITRGFAAETPNPFAVTGLPLVGGLLFAGVNGSPRGSFNQSFGNFGPRLGVAYRLDNKTVLRGGIGLIYGPMWYYPGEAPGFSQSTNMVSSIQAGVPFNTLSNPFPSGILKPVGSSQGMETDLGQSISFNDLDQKAPYVKQFSFGIQRQIPWGMVVSAAYVGSRSSRLPVTQQLNAPPVSALALGAAALTKSVSNPFAGLLPGTALNGPTVQQQQLLAPFPQFLVGTVEGGSGITEQYEPIGTSSYDSGQFLLTKRLSAGLDFSVAYTISKELDQNSFANAEDTHLQKNIATWDVPQQMQINLLWNLPFGANQAFGADLVQPVRWAASGWSFSALTRLEKGMPLNLSGSPNSVPIGNPGLPNPTLSRWFNTCTLLQNGNTRGCVGNETPVWAVRQPFQMQTWSTTIASSRYPGIHNTDLSLMKNNHLAGQFNLLFRTDFINAFNSPQWFEGAVSDVNSPQFGEIAGAKNQDNLPRFVQFSLKLEF